MYRMIKRSALVFAASAVWMAAAASAQSTNTFTRDFRFPPVGIASTETIQINVVNNASNSSSGTAASCAGTVTFTNASGAAIGTATSFTVTSGQVFSASLPFLESRSIRYPRRNCRIRPVDRFHLVIHSLRACEFT
jgi:hypothetical protein